VQMIESRKRVLAPEHADTLSNMSNLAFIWKDQGRDKEAIILLTERVQLRERVLGPDHPFTSSRAVLNRWEENLELGSSDA
jgi:hypothetical protein